MNSPPPDETCLSKAQRYLAQHKAEREELDMTVNMKAGTPEGVHSAIPRKNKKEVVREIDTASSPAPAGTENFISAMEEGLSPDETTNKDSSGLSFIPPGGKSTKTISETFAEVTTQFKLMMVQLWLPQGYEVVESAPLVDVRQFFSQARKLWDAYQPLLGAQNTTLHLQVDEPEVPEEEIVRGNPT